MPSLSKDARHRFGALPSLPPPEFVFHAVDYLLGDQQWICPVPSPPSGVVMPEKHGCSLAKPYTRRLG